MARKRYERSKEGTGKSVSVVFGLDTEASTEAGTENAVSTASGEGGYSPLDIHTTTEVVLGGIEEYVDTVVHVSKAEMKLELDELSFKFKAIKQQLDTMTTINAQKGSSPNTTPCRYGHSCSRRGTCRYLHPDTTSSHQHYNHQRRSNTPSRTGARGGNRIDDHVTGNGYSQRSHTPRRGGTPSGAPISSLNGNYTNPSNHHRRSNTPSHTGTQYGDNQNGDHFTAYYHHQNTSIPFQHESQPASTTNHYTSTPRSTLFTEHWDDAK